MEYQNEKAYPFEQREKAIIQDDLELPIVFLSKERIPLSLLEGIFLSSSERESFARERNDIEHSGRERVMGKLSNSPRIQVKQNLNEESFSHQETKIDWSKYDKWNQPAREEEKERERERERLERESREELEQGLFGHYSFSMTR